ETWEGTPMENQLGPQNATGRGTRVRRFLLCALFAIAIGGYGQWSTSHAAPAGDQPVNPPGGHPLGDDPPDEEEYGEFLAKAEELIPVPANEVVKSIRMNAIAVNLGKRVYAQHCASCHGEDLRGSATAHAPDLTDNEWRFSGDDLASGGEM